MDQQCHGTTIVPHLLLFLNIKLSVSKIVIRLSTSINYVRLKFKHLWGRMKASNQLIEETGVPREWNVQIFMFKFKVEQRCCIVIHSHSLMSTLQHFLARCCPGQMHQKYVNLFLVRKLVGPLAINAVYQFDQIHRPQIVPIVWSMAFS